MFEKLFDEIEEKIKLIAKILFWIGLVGSVVLLISALVIESDGATRLTSLISAVLCFLSTYVTSILVYGFAELIENTKITYFRLGSIDKKIGKLGENDEEEKKRG